jgi:hypothetical protein
MHRKNFAKKKLHDAIQSLVGPGDFNTRISVAASILIHIEDADVPSALTADLDSLKALLATRTLTEETSRIATAAILDLYTALVRIEDP